MQLPQEATPQDQQSDLTVPENTPQDQQADSQAQGHSQAQGAVDIDPIIADIESKIPKNLKPLYDKALLSGMRIMFSKDSHQQMFLDQIDKPGPMAGKISEGIVALIYMLWTKSNQTLAPQLIVPLTVVLTLKAFDFLQKSGDPEATKQVLGDAVHDATKTIMQKFGAKPGQGAPVQPPEAGGMPAAPSEAPTTQPTGMMGAM